MSEDHIAVQVTAGDRPPLVRDLLSVVGSALDVLDRLQRKMRREGEPRLRWRLADMSLGSPARVALRPEGGTDARLGRASIAAFLDGLRTLEEAPSRVPPYFDVESLGATKGIVLPLGGELRRVEFSAPSWGTVAPSPRLAAHVDRLIGAKREAYGAFRGRLETLTIHNREAFTIWDQVTGQAVSCTFDPQMLAEIREHFGDRAAVFGRVRYSARGAPEGVAVTQVRWLREQADLPQFSDLEGIDITRGLDSVDHVRRLRDG